MEWNKKWARAFRKYTGEWAWVRDIVRTKGTPHKRKSPWKGKKLIFILSTGRTGTNFFAKFFRDHFSGVYAVHEPPVDIFPVSVRYYRGKMNFEKARTLFDHYRQGILKKLDKQGVSIYVESNPRLAFMIPVIKNLSSDVTILHITRSCKDYVRSGFSKEVKSQGKKFQLRSDKDPRERITSNDFPDDPYFGYWENMTRFERTCWFWQKKDRIIEEELRGDSRAARFFYEDLFLSSEPQKKWAELIRFIGLEDRFTENRAMKQYLQENIKNQNRHYDLGSWSTWPEEYKQALIRIAGDHIKALGYDL